MLKKITAVILGIVFLVSCYHEAKRDSLSIKNIETYNQAVEDLAHLDPGTLVFFDVDDTLTTSPDALARGDDLPFLFEFQLGFWHPTVLLSSETKNYYKSIIFSQAKRFVLEPAVIKKLINQLKSQGITVMVLTQFNTAPYGVIKNPLEWRYEMLRKEGLEFSRTYPNTKFTSVPEFEGGYPQLYNGLLFANGLSKGEVLELFLDHFKLKPSKIISFDDLERNLISVGTVCQQRQIPFQGYHYLAKTKLPPWNARRAVFQFDYVVEQEKWLTDEQADHILAGESAVGSH